MKDQKQRIGFFRQGSYDLIEVTEPFLIHPLIDRVLTRIRKPWWSGSPCCRRSISTSAPSNEAHLLMFTELKSYPPMDGFFSDLQKAVPEVIGITGFANRQKAFSLGKNQLTLDMEGITLKATEGNFYQVNWEQNRNMVRTVLDFAALTSSEYRAGPLLRHRQLLPPARTTRRRPSSASNRVFRRSRTRRRMPC